jgi:hypothetical protein
MSPSRAQGALRKSRLAVEMIASDANDVGSAAVSLPGAGRRLDRLVPRFFRRTVSPSRLRWVR